MRGNVDIRAAQTKAELGDVSVPQADPWRRSILFFVLTCLLTVVVVIGYLAALDPYDSGRFAVAPLWRGRIDPDKWSRVRDPQFNSAIIGDSRSEMLRPALLDEKTGLSFVSLSVRASQPIEQFVVLRSFLHHHPDARAVVIGLNEQWCSNPLQSDYQKHHWFFPDWLYEGNALNYLVHLYSFHTIQQVLAVKYVGGMREDGFEDYEPAFHTMKLDTLEAVRKKLAAVGRLRTILNSTDTFPAVGRLADILATLPSSTVVVLAWVPVNLIMVPEPGSPAEQELHKCHAEFAALAAARSRTQVINWSVDRPENRLDENFLDGVHYRTSLAEAFGADIAAALNIALPDR